MKIYKRLFDTFGPQGWWPGETPFEVCIGAILTQNTNWQNVEKAIYNLKAHGLLSPERLYQTPTPIIAQLIRPCGYYNLKTKRLKGFLDLLFSHFDGKLEKMVDIELEVLRTMLLKVKGIGPETADSILLYALRLPSFVVDAYTMRFLFRHDLIDQDTDYHQARDLFMTQLPRDERLFNEFHALIVALGKNYCKKSKPKCSTCPLQDV